MFEETPSQAWRERFGDDPPSGLPDLARFLNHRSVRQYSDEPVPESTVRGLVAAAQSAATSSNLQLWSIVSVEDSTLREQIAATCDNQVHVAKAPWFFAFLADHHRLRRAANRVGEAALGLDFTEFFVMAVIDASLAAERMVCAAEAQGLGICYIGALRNDPDRVREILALPEGLFAVFGLCLGYPAETSKAAIKPRLRPEHVWFRDSYDAGVDVEEYDQRMQAFYLGQNMRGDVSWSMRSGRRVDEKHLTGREVLRDYMRRQGFAKR